MLKQIREAFRNDDALTVMLRDFDQMLEKAQWVFLQTSPQHAGIGEVERLYEDIYATDKQINALERSIRYHILQHLGANCAQDASPCMMLMVVIKDAERIGDYCKNIFEVLLYCGASRYGSVHVGEFQEIRQQVEEMLSLTRQAFAHGDVLSAQRVIALSGSIARQTDFIVQQVLEAGPVEVPEPAARVLLARHYKRIGAHLSNICTAVTSPVHMLGYHDEGAAPHP